MKKQVAEEWIERGKHDLEVARILLQKKEYLDVVLFHLHQAVEKYLKGFLIYRGWELKKIHDIETLLTDVISFDEEFKKYLDFGRRLTAFYLEERYPPGPITHYSRKEVAETIGIVEDIIARIEKKIEKDADEERGVL